MKNMICCCKCSKIRSEIQRNFVVKSQLRVCTETVTSWRTCGKFDRYRKSKQYRTNVGKATCNMYVIWLQRQLRWYVVRFVPRLHKSHTSPRNSNNAPMVQVVVYRSHSLSWWDGLCKFRVVRQTTLLLRFKRPNFKQKTKLYSLAFFDLKTHVEQFPITVANYAPKSIILKIHMQCRFYYFTYDSA